MKVKVDNALLEKAITFATEKHKGQTRKGTGLPYIMHPLQLMNILMEVKPDSKNRLLLLIVCLLHDVVEDCNVGIAEIAAEFGQQIASLVDELTTDPDECARLGKTAYLTEKMMNMTSYGLRMKLIDRLGNVRDMKSTSKTFQLKVKTETESIIAKLRERKLTRTHKKLIQKILHELK